MKHSQVSLIVGLALAVFSTVPACAVELQVIAGGGIAAPLNEIAANFESISGHKVTIRYGTAPQLIKMASSGEVFDIAVVPQDVVKEASARDWFAAIPQSDVARVGIGVAVRKGAPKPDISTSAALKQTLLQAKSITSIPASATGAQLADIYQKLGITDEMKAKTLAQPVPVKIVEAVALGDADIAVFTLNVLIDPRIDIIGPLPADIQRDVVYVGSVAAATKVQDAGAAFLSYLKTPAATSVLKAKGMTPG